MFYYPILLFTLPYCSPLFLWFRKWSVRISCPSCTVTLWMIQYSLPVTICAILLPHNLVELIYHKLNAAVFIVLLKCSGNCLLVCVVFDCSQQACSTLNIDIISLKLDERLPFKLKHAQVGQVNPCTVPSQAYPWDLGTHQFFFRATYIKIGIASPAATLCPQTSMILPTISSWSSPICRL